MLSDHVSMSSRPEMPIAATEQIGCRLNACRRSLFGTAALEAYAL